MIKVAAPSMACQVIDWAIQMHGAAGISDDFPLAAAYAAARTIRLADAPDEVHREQIGKLELARHRPSDAGAGSGAAGFQPQKSPAFVAFSVVCFLFASYHSYTFLKLAGVIMHVKVLDKTVPPRVIVLTMFGLWALASIVIGAVLIGFGR